ncbi:hypothetical protein [Haloarcula sp. JP-L23]|uniref:hypothetical protein n=1 Tax=Haloarcula sp. JP-L23 TaxID=2716717 RepID=UPI00140F0D66|nr:hypothetical protein G9465_20930 [Haloarcula sp. JP-L23]
MFPTLHASSLHAQILDAWRSMWLSSMSCVRRGLPPSISVTGVRSVLKRICEAGNIHVEGDKEYLTPHGACRGVGEFRYRIVGFEAPQPAFRHEGPGISSQMDSHIEASELADVTGDGFESHDNRPDG